MLREAAGKSSERIKLDDSSSALELVEEIGKRNNARFGNLVFDYSGKIRKSLAFAVNGDTMVQSKLRSMKCKDISEFAILPPISGGSNYLLSVYSSLTTRERWDESCSHPR